MRNVARQLTTRGLEAAASLAILVTLTFVLAHASPGGPAYAIMGLKAQPSNAGEIDQLLGTDIPVWQQYGVWCGTCCKADLACPRC